MPRLTKPVFQPKKLIPPVPFAALAADSPQATGRKKERQIAKDLKGSLQPGSGCFPGKGGDVIVRKTLVESKYTTTLSYTLSIHTLRKLKREAFEQDKDPALVIEFSGHFYFPAEKWALIPYEQFKEFLKKP